MGVLLPTQHPNRVLSDQTQGMTNMDTLAGNYGEIFKQAVLLTFDIRNTVLQTVKQLQVYTHSMSDSIRISRYLAFPLYCLLVHKTIPMMFKIRGGSTEIDSLKTFHFFRSDIFLNFALSRKYYFCTNLQKWCFKKTPISNITMCVKNLRFLL